MRDVSGLIRATPPVWRPLVRPNLDGVMTMKRLPVLALMAFCAAGVLAAEHHCPAPAPAQPQAAAPADEHCAKPPPEQCQKKKGDVSWLDFAIGSHQMPSLHFVDFLELFVR